MGLRDFLKKTLDFFGVEEERNLPGNAGKSDAQLRTEYEQKGTHSLKSILSAELTQQTISVLLLKSTIRKLFAGYARARLKIIFGIRRSKMFWCTR